MHSYGSLVISNNEFYTSVYFSKQVLGDGMNVPVVTACANVW